jgi:hypothetical protein
VVAGQPHELARGGAKALQNVEDPPQKNLWTAMPFLGIGIAGQVQPLVDRRVLAAAVVTSVTMELAILLARAIETQAQPAACSIVETSCYPELEKLRPLP